MKNQIEVFFFLLLSRFVRALSFERAVALGAGLGRLLHRFDKKHRLIALGNLRPSFKDKSETELEKILLGVYENIGRSGIEAIRLGEMTTEQISAGCEIVEGVILLGAHFGSWEWIPLALGVEGVPMYVIVRPVNNPLLDQRLQEMRERFGNVVLNKRTETGEIIKLLRKGKSIGFLLDQDVGRNKGIFVDFFGRPATIALRTKAPVLPMFIVRKKGGHQLIIEKPIALPKTGRLKQDMIEKSTTLFTKKIESYVRQYPDHWLWLHRRWKTQPEEPKHLR